MTPPRPRHRLSTRMALMFLLATVPAWLATGAAVLSLDRLVAQEIDARGRSARAALARHLQAEQSRLQRTMDRLVDDPALTRLIGQLDAKDFSPFDGVASRLAASAGLDVFAIVADQGPWRGLLLSSAHLSEAVEDPAPAFVAGASEGPVGIVYETVEGNPIQRVPALVALRLVRARPKLREEYSWVWIATAIAVTVLAIEQDLLLTLTSWIGAASTASTLFFGGIIFLMVLCVQFSVRLSRLTHRQRTLAQRLALLEEEVQELRRRRAEAPGERAAADRDPPSHDEVA